MASDEKLKIKSERNWRCVELLREYQPKDFDVAASRLYYSIFLLLKSDMVKKSKMSATSATKPHKLALEHYKELNNGNEKPLRDLQDLRNTADYEPKLVTREAFEHNLKIWTKWRNDFLSRC